jgi:hypothetical protein
MAALPLSHDSGSAKHLAVMSRTSEMNLSATPEKQLITIGFYNLKAWFYNA